MRLYRVLFVLLVFGSAAVWGCGSSPAAHGVSAQGAEHVEGPLKIAEPQEGENPIEPVPEGEKVPVTVYIMSKCPFAVKVMDTLLELVVHLGDNLALSFQYIGRDKNGELTSMHGRTEIEGNILQLCAREHGDTRQWVDFLRCQNEQWRQIPEGWQTCVERAGLPYDAMDNCYRGDQGEELLRESFAISKEAKATGSPTTYVGGEVYRGGRSSLAFARAICERYREEPAPAYCGQIPPPIRVDITIVADERCKVSGCDPGRFESFLSSTLEGAEIRTLDYSDPEGKELFERSEQEFLPIAVFSASVKNEEDAYQRLRRRLVTMERSDGEPFYVYPLGRNWDPEAEVCDDQVDNTGNGKVDCKDPSCSEKKLCRKEKKKHLALFAMSKCPYAVRVLRVMPDVLELLGRKGNNMKFSIEYIGTNSDGKLSAMHGQSEVDENKRQVCAQKHYPRNHKWMKYVSCRADQFSSDHSGFDENWRQCAVGGIKAKVIAKCAEGKEGERLLAESYDRSKALEMSGSPSWLLNNRLDMKGRSADDIVKAFCEQNNCPARVTKKVEDKKKANLDAQAP